MSAKEVQCPNCGEVVPALLVRCRYCHATIQPPGSPAESAASQASGLSITDSQNTASPQRPRGKGPAESSAKGSVKSARTKAGVAGRVQSTASSAESAVESAAVADSPPNAAQPTPSAALAPTAKQDALFTRLMLGCLALLLFSPLSVSGPLPGDAELSVGLPAIHSGDEPHYLIQLHSILQDGDLDLANNYAAVHAGGVEAGRKFAGGALDHHVAWYRDGRLVQWWEAYEIDPAKWDRDAAGRPTPTRRADSTQLPVSDREYSQHAPGLPLLLAGVLWPVGGTALVEPLALTLAAAATCLGALSFFRLVRPYSSSLEWVLFVVIAAYLGSPLWHYGRTLYTEPFVAAMTVSAYAAVLRGRSYLLAGLLMGAAVLCKVPYLVIALPLAAAAAVERDWSGLWKFAAPMLAAMLVALWWNYTLRDGWWHMPARWLWSRPFVGIFGMLFSPRHGLLLFTPVVLLAIASTPEWWRRHRRDALVIGGGVLSHFLLMSSYEQWWGGHAYSSRYFVAVLPLAFVPLAMLRDSAMWRERPAVKWAAGVIVLLSIGMNLIAAYACEHVWDRHPLELVVSRW